MLNRVTVWDKIEKYSNTCAIKTSNLVEFTWLTRYPWPTKITYDQESEFMGPEIRNP